MSGSARPRLLAYTDSETIGGAELALGYLLAELAPQVIVGVLATQAHVAEAIAAARPGVSVGVLRAPSGLGDRAALAEHVRAVRAFAPDVLHANQAWPWACGYGELAGVLLPGVRVLAVDHLPIASAMPRRRVLARRLLARGLDAHVSVGERAARLIEEMVGLRAGSVGAVPNGVPIAPEQARTPFPDDAARGPVIGSLGRLTAQKGYDLLVRALAQLPLARLTLVGEGPERGPLEALAAELGVASRVTITGWSADARAHLSSFDIFALPSRWEGMPLSILEAMHAGLPVVASEVGSVADAVSDGDTGFLVGPGDQPALQRALARLLEDPELRAQMGGAALRCARERFAATVMARRYEEIYTRLAPRAAWGV